MLYCYYDFSAQGRDEQTYLQQTFTGPSRRIAISTPEQLLHYLTRYGGSGGAISIILHGGPLGFSVGKSGSSRVVFWNSYVLSLRNNLQQLRILTCNGGHLDFSDNLANTFLRTGRIDRLYASDGAVSFYPTFFVIRWLYRARLSSNQRGFFRLVPNASPCLIYAPWCLNAPLGMRCSHCLDTRQPIGIYRAN